MAFASIALVSLSLFTAAGCQVGPRAATLPVEKTIVREQLVVHSNFHVPSKHRLLDELVARRTDISDRLKLPVSDEPINVYLFEDGDKFRQFMASKHPNFPDRRAFFVKNDTTLTVLAYWGDRAGEDLRHEVTHGYLHSVVPNLPLWLDEGIAEYFETPRGKHGFNSPHIYQLANAFRRGEWKPDLVRLEEIRRPELMTQEHYAESWLWVHFLLESSVENQRLLQDQLARLRMSGDAGVASEKIVAEIPDVNEQLLKHLKTLAEKM